MNTKTTPKDFFLHIGAAIALYASVAALINLVFTLINYALPDTLAYGFYANNVAWPISVLIILVPVLYVIEWLIRRDIRIMPEKGDLWIRRWRIYLTLFLTSVTIIVDLISLINTYMNGEISARFAYKVLAVLVISAVVLAFFVMERLSGLKYRNVSKYLSWVGIVLVLAAIVWGFAVVGSPRTQRMLRIDNQRVGDLQNIQWQIVNHWQNDGKLPASLTDLNDSISYYKIPTDPETKAPYSYIVTASTTFKLCAQFNRPTEDNEGRGNYGRGGYAYSVAVDASPTFIGDNGSNWDHPEGNHCFERTIDPSKYPVMKK